MYRRLTAPFIEVPAEPFQRKIQCDPGDCYNQYSGEDLVGLKGRAGILDHIADPGGTAEDLRHDHPQQSSSGGQA